MLDELNQALPVWRHLGDRPGEATALTDMGRVHNNLGQRCAQDPQSGVADHARGEKPGRRGGRGDVELVASKAVGVILPLRIEPLKNRIDPLGYCGYVLLQKVSVRSRQLWGRLFLSGVKKALVAWEP
jgi:hypothetical protein